MTSSTYASLCDGGCQKKGSTLKKKKKCQKKGSTLFLLLNWAARSFVTRRRRLRQVAHGERHQQRHFGGALQRRALGRHNVVHHPVGIRRQVREADHLLDRRLLQLDKQALREPRANLVLGEARLVGFDLVLQIDQQLAGVGEVLEKLEQQSIRLGLLGVELRLDGLADALGDGRQIVVARTAVPASSLVASLVV